MDARRFLLLELITVVALLCVPSVGWAQQAGAGFGAYPAALTSSRLPEPNLRYDYQLTPTAYQPTPPAEDEMSELRRRLDATESELAALRSQSKSAADKLVELLEANQPSGPDLPLIRLSGFFQLDDGLFSQTADSHTALGSIKDGVDFRRARLQALGAVTEFTRYSIEVDFATVGRPSLMDIWGEHSNLPFFGTIRIGHFRQPTTMDGLTSVRHLEFLERSLPYQAMDPFRRTGIMAYRVSDDEMSTLAYSMYATGFTFFNGTGLSYGTIGDTRFASELGNSGGVSFAVRATHLLYYDEPAEGRYLLHIGGGYDFSGIGGQGTTGSFAKTYQARPIPEFFEGDAAGPAFRRWSTRGGSWPTTFISRTRSWPATTARPTSRRNSWAPGSTR